MGSSNKQKKIKATELEHYFYKEGGKDVKSFVNNGAEEKQLLDKANTSDRQYARARSRLMGSARMGYEADRKAAMLKLARGNPMIQAALSNRQLNTASNASTSFNDNKRKIQQGELLDRIQVGTGIQSLSASALKQAAVGQQQLAIDKFKGDMAKKELRQKEIGQLAASAYMAYDSYTPSSPSLGITTDKITTDNVDYIYNSQSPSFAGHV